VFAPGSSLPVDQFPILKLIPDSFLASKGRARKLYNLMSTLWEEAVRRVKERRASGDKRISLLDQMLDEDVKVDVALNDRQTANFLGSIVQGAADTTSGMMLTNTLYLANNRWVQKKAQQELDRVCGDARVPTWEDFEQLPYINCIVKEGLRIQPV
jgi:cytochrome P450